MKKNFKKPIDINDSEVRQLFNEYGFRIPQYQRNFVWDEELIDTIFQTFIGDYNDKVFLFFGNLLIASENNKLNIKEVIDGQQRLTFIYLTLLSFYEFFVEMRKEILQKKRDNKNEWPFIYLKRVNETIEYLVGFLFRKNVNNKWESRMSYDNESAGKALKRALTPLLDALSKYEFIEDIDLDHLCEAGVNFNKKTKVSKIYEKIKNNIVEHIRLNEKDRELNEAIDECEDFLEFVLDASFQRIELKDPASAPEIFERINSNSKPLTDWHLVKNYIYKNLRRIEDRNLKPKQISKMASNFVEKIGNKIDPNDDISSSLDEKIIIQAWEIYLINESSPKTMKYKVLRNHYKNYREETSQNELIVKLKDDVEKIVDSYRKLVDLKFEDEKTLLIWLLIENYNLKQLKKYFIALFAKYGENKYINDAFILLIVLTFNIIVFHGSVANILEGSLRLIFKRENSSVRDVNEVHPEQFINRIKDSNIFNAYNETYFNNENFEKLQHNNIIYATLIIALYEMGKLSILSRNRKNETTININNFQVEHILPKASLENWIKNPDSGYKDFTEKELRDKYVELPGNKFVLFGEYNNRVSNKYITEKMEGYKISEFWNPNKYKLDYANIIVPKIKERDPKWTPKNIKKRTRDMQEFFSKTMIDFYDDITKNN